MGLMPNPRLEPGNFDLTRSTFEKRVTVELHPEVELLEEGMWMVHTQDGKYVRPSQGKPYETLAGVAFVPDPFGGTYTPGAVTLGTGDFRIFTLFYADGPWTATNRTLPILGPNGEVTIGKFPRDLPIAIGRVVRAPDDDEPYLGITGKAFG